MADEADVAYEVTRTLTENPVNPYSYLPKIVPNGLCHFCEAELELEGQLFCDELCARDWADRVKMEVQLGRR